MYNSNDYRYRNLTTPANFARRRSPPPAFVILAVAVLLVCCLCSGLVIGWQIKDSAVNPLAKPQSVGTETAPANPFQGFSGLFGGARPTPTLDKNAPVPLRAAGAGENGLELAVLGMQRPLKTDVPVKLPPNEQFVLVSVQITNTRRTGQPVTVNGTDFKIKGFGGVTYDANPKTVTIPQILNKLDLPAGRSLSGELIFQIATDDGDLRLYWTSGKTTREFLLEKPK
ncbi:MAG: DUF4352 domain-containing protein [Chloroflexi bacterium]|nr:DUF4352 domain-containing protein [Chloroflexota bacterium]